MTRPERPASPERPETPAAPERPGAPQRPAAPGGAATVTARRRRQSDLNGVPVARSTIPTCLILGVLLPTLGLIRLASDEASAWHFGPDALGWLLIFCGLILLAAGAMLMRFVAHRLGA